MSSPQTAIPFGNFLLIKRLAVGGMAELFLAQRPPEPELVVLKRILPHLSEEPEFVRMFLDEARIAAQLHHPNIVQTHALGNWDDNIFIAMEYVEGVDLRRAVAEEAKYGATVPFGVAARICAQVAAGLDYAHHSRGVDGRPLELIHRDVSPQNVMIAYDGRVKLVDFGIAKAGAFMARSKPGVIKGKFLYLAPEQVSQERLDHRADIFALGTMLYEITTGKQPFSKPTTEGILYAIRNEDPLPPHLLRADYPEPLSRIIMKCLMKDRRQRYQRASAVRADLESFLESGALRQSLDVADYLARLLGSKEERTILHIPVARGAGRRDATVPLPGARVPVEAAPPQCRSHLESTAPSLSSTPPAAEPPVPPAQRGSGFTSQPALRCTSGDAPPAPSSADEPEFATLMVRPWDLPTSVRDEDDEVDADIPTAIDTTPTGHQMALLVAAELELDDSQHTVLQQGCLRDERPNTSSAPPVPQSPLRRSGPHAEPPPRPSGISESPRSRLVSAPPAPATVPPSRTPRQDAEDSQSVCVTPPAPPRRPSHGDEEASQSVSLTPAMVNPRAVSRPGPPASRLPVPNEEDDSFPTDSGMSTEEHTSPTPTLRTDPEDDESSPKTNANLPRRRFPVALLVVGGGALLLTLGAGLIWALHPLTDATRGELSNSGLNLPTRQEPAPARPEGSTPDVNTLAPGGTGALQLATAAGSRRAGGAPDARRGPTPVPPVVDGADAGTPEPVLVAVRFKAPPRTVLRREGGEKLPVNQVVSLPPGRIRVRYDCPGRRAPKGTRPYLIKPGGEGPFVLQVPCKGRR